MKNTIYHISLLILLLGVYSCVEEFNAATIEFEDAIVIEATITNELKHQEISLFRTYKFEESGPSSESGATVQIITPNNTYSFHETESGIYMSDIEFQAEPNLSYTLSISTLDGRAYTSDPTILTNSTAIENLYALREIDDNGVDGIGIYVDSFDPTNSSKYYGYEFEETYEIIAPLWAPDGYLITSQVPFLQFIVAPRTQEEQFCYNTLNSAGRLLTDTNLLTEDRVSRFLIEFIPIDDIRNSSRYSILVKQYIQTLQAYNFHKTINDLTSSESLFSQNQPGFFSGNVFSIEYPNEKVLGYFEVSSVSEERIFFNRSDFSSTPYPWTCRVYTPAELEELFSQDLSTLIRLDRISYHSGTGDPGDPLISVLRQCGDCTKLGSNIKPDFWID